METTTLNPNQAASHNLQKPKAPCTVILEEQGYLTLGEEELLLQRVEKIEQILVDQKTEHIQLHQIIL